MADVMCDGFGWKPLSFEVDFACDRPQRIVHEIFLNSSLAEGVLIFSPMIDQSSNVRTHREFRCTPNAHDQTAPSISASCFAFAFSTFLLLNQMFDLRRHHEAHGQPGAGCDGCRISG